jgi:SAM-dependent methyltransferase
MSTERSRLTRRRPGLRLRPMPGSDLPLRAAERHRLRRDSFDRVAALYDRSRPRYPEELFDELVRLAGLKPGGRVLEIGPGTGQATLPLARRGLKVLALERSANMARLCCLNLRGFPEVEIRITAFEDWPLEQSAFDLVIAASAFHWLSPRTAFRACARALKPGGGIALVWNFRTTPDDEFQRDLQRVYTRVGMKPWIARDPEQRIAKQRRAIENSGAFGPVQVRRHPWSGDYDADRYVGLLRTMSDHAIRPTETRRRLWRGIRRVFARNGGLMTRHHVAGLLFARRRPTLC